jgi:hypothetical protein
MRPIFAGNALNAKIRKCTANTEHPAPSILLQKKVLTQRINLNEKRHA